MGKVELDILRADLGARAAEGQLNQNPIAAGGGLFKRAWWKRYREAPIYTRIVQFWDCAQKPGITNDYSVCATGGESEYGFFLMDIWRNKVSAPQLEQAVQNQYDRFKPNAIVIEDKSSGSSLIQNMNFKTKLPILPWEPGQRDKQVRASAVTPTVESGKVYLPEIGDWIETFIIEHERFPNAEHDDQVDTTSMALEYLRAGSAFPRIRSLG